MFNRRETFKLLATGMTVAFTGIVGAENIKEEAKKPKVPDFPTEEGAWTMVIIPDPQVYVILGRNQGLQEVITAWIADNIEKYRIKQVLVTGDLVYRNNIGAEGDRQSSQQQWNAISRAFERLDGKLPYIICTGNHDYGFRDSENRETQVNKYFPANRNPSWNGVLVEMGKNTFGEQTLENAAYEFTTPSGQKMLTISLPFAPPDESLAWARELVAREQYKNHFVTVLTHSYINGAGKRPVSEHYQFNKDGGNAGEGIWQKLVKVSPNIRLVVNGHFTAPDRWDMCTGFSFDTNDAGKKVAQMLFDTQAMGGGFYGNGGDGWIRLLEFSADLKTVKVRTFSPVFDILPIARQYAWERSERNEFTFSFDD